MGFIYVYSYILKTWGTSIFCSIITFHKWKKNCFTVIFIISKRMRLKWKIVWSMKRNSLYRFMIWRKFTHWKEIVHIFWSHNTIKIAWNMKIWINFITFHIRFKVQNMVEGAYKGRKNYFIYSLVVFIVL